MTKQSKKMCKENCICELWNQSNVMTEIKTVGSYLLTKKNICYAQKKGQLEQRAISF